MSTEQPLPEIRLDTASLYQEDVFTDRTAGTIRRLRPVTADGSADPSRPMLYSGQTQLLTPGGVLPLGFEIEATSLTEAIERFPQAVRAALEQAIEEAREMRREASSRIVVPEAGGGGLGGLGGAGMGGGSRIKL
jgi:outer membrane lipoprotein SlyB